MIWIGPMDLDRPDGSAVQSKLEGASSKMDAAQHELESNKNLIGFLNHEITNLQASPARTVSAAFSSPFSFVPHSSQARPDHPNGCDITGCDISLPIATHGCARSSPVL